MDRDKTFKILDEDGIHITLAGYCPVQGEGFVDNHPIYFRARGTSWSFSISESNTNAINVRWGQASGWYFEEPYGVDFEAGWMPYEIAQQFIKESVRRYRAGEGYISQSKGVI